MIQILCHLNLCTEQLIHSTALSKLRESAEISAVRYTNLKGKVYIYLNAYTTVFIKYATGTSILPLKPRIIFFKIINFFVSKTYIHINT